MAVMTLEPLTLDGAKGMLKLREQNRAAMRTEAPINEEDQENWFYHATSRDSPRRWWQVTRDKNAEVMGYCGIEDIKWIARTGEMSLLIDGSDDEWQDMFDLLLQKAFWELNLVEVHAEVYRCSPDIDRWLRVQEVFGAYMVALPMRKYWDGQYWDGAYISWRLPV